MQRGVVCGSSMCAGGVQRPVRTIVIPRPRLRGNIYGMGIKVRRRGVVSNGDGNENNDTCEYERYRYALGHLSWRRGVSPGPTPLHGGDQTQQQRQKRRHTDLRGGDENTFHGNNQSGTLSLTHAGTGFPLSLSICGNTKLGRIYLRLLILHGLLPSSSVNPISFASSATTSTLPDLSMSSSLPNAALCNNTTSILFPNDGDLNFGCGGDLQTVGR